MGGSIWLRGAALALVLLLATSAAAWPGKRDNSLEAQLARWIVSQGGKVKGSKVGRECPTCLRGVVATKDFKSGDLIMMVPFATVMRLKEIEHSAFPAEYARDLLDAMHNDPSHNETWDLFWSAHPAPGETLTPEVFTDEQLQMLQSSELESLVSGQRQVTEQVYDGTYPYQPYKHFRETVPEDKVGLDTFKHVASLLGSRYFGFYRDGNTEKSASHLVPLVDLINHADDPNAERSDDGVNVLVRAIKPIRKGQEITNSYQPGVIHRPDMSLYIYGFVIEREVPNMAAVDLPTFNPQDPFEQTPTSDDFYDDPKGEHVSRQEYDRLQGVLAGCPTTEEQDQAELDGGEVTDWRTRSILLYRVMRKRALRLNIARLAKTLNISEDDGSSGPPAPKPPQPTPVQAEAEEEEVEVDDVEEGEEAKQEL